jgi:hypothetical protein
MHTNPETITLTEIRSRQGKNIEFRVTGGPVGGKFTDYLVKFLVNTTFNNVLTIPINIRIFV